MKALPLLLMLYAVPAFAVTLNLEGFINTILALIIVGAIFALLYWLLKQVPIPEPFKWVGNLILGILVVMFLIVLLLSLLGGGPVITIR